MSNLVDGFWQSTQRWPQRPALWVQGSSYSYQQLGCYAQTFAELITRYQPDNQPVAAVLAYRCLTAYAGILGILTAGKGYVPLHPHFPMSRTTTMLQLSKANVLIVASDALELIEPMLGSLNQRLAIIWPGQLSSDASAAPVDALETATEKWNYLRRQWPTHSWVGPAEFTNRLNQTPSAISPKFISTTNSDEAAYLLFTSGSTGVPKGVPVSHGNVTAYLHYITARYAVQPEDRFSQAFDLTFDLSVHDLFVCWWSGACLCVIPHEAVMAPAKFIRDQQLTLWFSVPSVAMFMSRMRMLKPGVFPTLRWSLFCGEPLPESSAAAWQEAAPNSIVENLYGPTEATIAITHYRWDYQRSSAECVNGVVPIGQVFATQQVVVIDERQRPVATGVAGELCLSGSQVTRGYLNNPEKTREQYIRLHNNPLRVWYRTGDLVRQDEQGCIYYLGRIDQQVQVLGHRVELQEVDHALRELSGTELAVAIPWPVHTGQAEALYGVLAQARVLDDAAILAQLRQRLPDYMIPKKLFRVESLPLNANGKIDRNALNKQVAEWLSKPRSS
ncbi:MAG: Tyrocidine synthase 3 [Phycisphaerae bacterium]|nr:Tyrocidine synthase 3 [Phycisphaerae bacterium]